MLRRSYVALDSFKEHYHRINLPRRTMLELHIRKQRLQASIKQGNDSDNKKSRLHPQRDGDNVPVPYKYNRWWVSNHAEFVHQYAYVEDPTVIRERRTQLPAPTSEKIWKAPFQTIFLPFSPHIPVVDYPKDPDAKNLKPVNVPRWKDYMMRDRPVVPRTWY